MEDVTHNASEELVHREAVTRVTLQEVQHVADLANLALTAEELPRMARDLDAVLGYIAQLDEVDTASLAPMAQGMAALGGAEAASRGEALRPDTLRPSVERAAVMREAPESDGRFFKVPRVIER